MIFKRSIFFSCFSGRNSGREERLWNAAKSGNLAEVNQLLQNTFVDPTPEAYSEDNNGETPLLRAGKIFFFSS